MTHKRIKPVIEEIVADSVEQESPAVDSAKQEVTEVKEAIVDQAPEHPILEEIKKQNNEKIQIGFGFLATVVVVALFVALVSGGLYVYFNGIESLKISQEEPEVTTTPLPTSNSLSTPVPSPSPKVEVKIADLKISVLNGSGKIGEAGKAKALIEKAGFKVTQTGNAQSFNFPNTLIQSKSSVSREVINKLKESLSSAYTLTDGDALDTKSSFDIIVTVGQK